VGRVDVGNVGDYGEGFCDSVGGGGVAVGRRAERGVHADAADESALAFEEAGGGQDVGTGGVGGGEVGGCCCAMGEEAGDAVCVDFAGFDGVAEGGFEGVGVGC